MANINLLPWREREREERKKQFLITLAITAAVAALIVVAVDRFMANRISFQNERNAYLTQAIASLDEEIAEIRRLQEQKRNLTERMAVIQDLQGRRPLIVRLFDELVRTLPDGIYYENLTSDETNVSINGLAESNSRITALMRSLEDSEWFGVPQFRTVTAEDSPASAQVPGRNRFQINVRISSPDTDNAQNGVGSVQP